jgi:hypothetical protein
VDALQACRASRTAGTAVFVLSGTIIRHKAISRDDPIVQVFSPCETGTRLLEDFTDLRTSAFAGLPEWDAFADHEQECIRCGEI